MNETESLLVKIREVCAHLKLTSLADYAIELEEDARKQGLSYLEFLFEILENLYQMQQEIRAKRRIKAAKFSRIKTLDSFNFDKDLKLPETLIRQLATGEFIREAKPIIFIGESGTGKTHLATAIGYSSAQKGFKVFFITVADLANQLIEAKDAHTLSLAVKRFSGYDLLILDELGFVPLSQVDAELIFQVLSKRHEMKSTLITTNLPFSEWTSVFKDLRLCRAVIDRITYKATIISTGNYSERLRETLKEQELKK